MTVGRILANGIDLGSGFALATSHSKTTRVALTARHVVSNQEPLSLQFITQEGRGIPVERVELDKDLDVAVLHLGDDVPEGLTVGRAVNGAGWQVKTQPSSNDPILHGTITDTHHRFVKQDGEHEIYVLQLDVKENLGDYGGYSGSPVVLSSPFGAVIGILDEQYLSRLAGPLGQPRPATNVLYAIPIQDVLERFALLAVTQLSLTKYNLLHSLFTRHMLFGGREKELQQLNDFVSQHTCGYMFITARSGIGKTALLANWVKTLLQNNHDGCYHFISRSDTNLADEVSIMISLCKQLLDFYGLSYHLPTHLIEMRSLYLTLLGTPLPEGKRLIVVLDSLDEVFNWTPGSYLFPHSLPKGVFVVFSAREISNWDWITKLGLSHDIVDTLRLETLGVVEIAHLLSLSGEVASQYASNTEFIEALYKASRGDPFYLHFLLEDIESRHLNEKNIGLQPDGLDGYLTEWWNQLNDDIDINRHEINDLLGILTIAKGPLLARDLAGVSPLLRKGALLDRELSGKFRRYIVGNPWEGYALCHPRFGNYLQTKFFPEELQDYREKLLSYCARWQEHKSKYALSFYPVHLFELGRTSGIYALINKDWMDTLFERDKSHHAFSANVELAMAAAENEIPPNTVQMVRNSFVYTALGSLAIQIPPNALKLLTEMGQRKRAESYAMLMLSTQQRSKAFCQIGIALMQQGKPSEATDNFENAIKVANSIDDPGARALQLAEIVSILAQIEEDWQVEEIANQAINIAIAPSIAQRSWSQYSSLHSVASAFARAGLVDFTAAALNAAAEAALDANEEPKGQISVGFELMRELIKRERIEEAVQLFGSADDPTIQCLFLVGLMLEIPQTESIAQMKAITEIVDRLPALVELITHSQIKPLLLAQVARVFARIGEKAKATGFANQALDLAEAITEQPERPWILASVARSLAQIAEIEHALQVAESIADSNADFSSQRAKGEALAEVAKALALAGDYEHAIVVSNTSEILKQSGKYVLEYILLDEIIQGQHDNPSAFIEVVRTVAEAGLVGQAQTAAKGAPDSSKRDSALFEIAKTLILMGKVEEALATIDMANSSSLKLTDIAELLFQVGKKEQAENIVERVLAQANTSYDAWCECEAISKVVEVLAQAGQVNEALAVIDTMTKGQAAMLMTIIQILIERGENSQAVSLLEKAMAIANQTGEWTADIVRQARGGKYSQLRSLMENSLLLKVAVSLFQLGQIQQVEDVVDQVLTDVNSSSEYVREGVFAQGITVLARLGLLDQAFKLISKFPWRNWFVFPVLSELIKALFQAGKRQHAEQVIAKTVGNIPVIEVLGGASIRIYDKYHHEYFLETTSKLAIVSEYIAILAEGGLVDQVLTMLEDNEIALWVDIEARTTLIRELGLKGRIATALEITNRVVAQVEATENWSEKARSLARIFKLVAPVGRCDLVLTLADHAINAARKAYVSKGEVESLVSVAQTLSQIGDVDQALGIAEEVTDHNVDAKVSILESVAKVLIKARKKERAIEIANQIASIAGTVENTGYKVSLLSKSATVLVDAEENEQALLVWRGALSFTHFSSSADYFNVLLFGVPILAAIDHCHTLWNVHQALLEIDKWWSTNLVVPQSSMDTSPLEPQTYARFTKYFIQ